MATEDNKERKLPTLTHGQCVRRLEEITAEMERLAELDELSEDDEKYFASIREDFANTDALRKKLEFEDELVRARAVTAGLPGSRLRAISGTPVSTRYDYDRDVFAEPTSVEAFRGARNPWDLSEMRTFSRSGEAIGQEFRARALAAIEKMSGANDKVREAATDIVERFDDGDSKIAKMVLATSSPEYLRAFSKLAKNQQHLLSTEESHAVERAMSLSKGSGGYLVPFQLDPTVIITANGSRNQIRQAARKVVATGDVWNGVAAGAVTWNWRPEAQETTDNSPTFTQPSINIYKANGFVPISIEALADEANVTQEVGRLLAFGRDVLEASTFTIGAGPSGTPPQPTGLITALAAAGGSTVVAQLGAAGVFAVGDVYNLDSLLPARYRPDASWMANRRTYNLIRQFGTTDGHALWERVGLDVPAQLLGRPAYEAEDMDGIIEATGAVNNYLLVYGDFSNYVIADRIGMTVEFVPHLFGGTGATHFPTGQRGWYAYYRVGAGVVNAGGFRMLNVKSPT